MHHFTRKLYRKTSQFKLPYLLVHNGVHSIKKQNKIQYVTSENHFELHVSYIYNLASFNILLIIYMHVHVHVYTIYIASATAGK